jgi:hypothetical protein
MTEDRLPLVELLQQAGDGNSLCSAAAVLQLLMEVDVEGRGGESYARSKDARRRAISSPASTLWVLW